MIAARQCFCPLAHWKLAIRAGRVQKTPYTVLEKATSPFANSVLMHTIFGAIALLPRPSAQRRKIWQRSDIERSILWRRSWDSEMACFEIYGEKGTICIPDPDPVHGANMFQGEVWYRTCATSRWTVQPRPSGRNHWQLAFNSHGLNEDCRGIGLVDMALAIREGRAPRASGEMAYHACEVMSGILDSPQISGFFEINSRCAVPEPLPKTFPSTEI